VNPTPPLAPSILIGLALLIGGPRAALASSSASPEGATLAGASQEPTTGEPMLQACRKEIVELHRFFEDWFVGRLDDDDGAYARFEAVMGEGFEIVSPDGRRTERAALVDRLRRAHGFQRGAEAIFEIRVKEVRPRSIGPGLYLVSYEEWHKSGAGDRGRISTALLREREGTPNGLEWLHVHETWLPTDASR